MHKSKLNDNSGKIDLSKIKVREKQPDTTETKKEPTNLKNDVKMMKDVIKDAKKDKKEEDATKKETTAIDRQRLILILQFYLLEFPEQLKGFKGISYDKKTIEELQEIRSQMDATISSKNSIKQTQLMITSSIRTLEFVATTMTPIRCNGLSDLMTKDPEVMDTIKHISLKRMSNVVVEPELKLLYQVASNILLLHNVNSQGATPPKNNNPAINEINTKYEDL